MLEFHGQVFAVNTVEFRGVGGLCLLVFESQMSSLSGIAAQHKHRYISTSVGVMSEMQEMCWVATGAVKIRVDLHLVGGPGSVSSQAWWGRTRTDLCKFPWEREVGDAQYSQ